MKPNVVLINMDDLGYGDLGCYGSQLNDSPHIDNLATQGIRCTDFYSCSSVCSPSRAGLMSGSYPARVGINRVLFPGENIGLNPSEYTLPRLFKDNGYATSCIGKWHCGDQIGSLPLDFGFDEYFGLPYSNDMGVQVGEKPCWQDGYGCALPLMEQSEVIEGQPDQRSLTTRYVEHAKSFIRKNKDKPFFLYFAQMHVHLPLYADKRFVERSRNGDFGACVMSADWAVGCIIKELKSKKLYDNTIIIFTSDNGARGDYNSSNGVLRGHKSLTFDGGQKVPFIIKLTNQTDGRVCDKLASNIDLLPTFAEMLNTDLPNKIDGISIMPSLVDDVETRKEFVFFRHAPLSNEPIKERSAPAAIRLGNMKLHYSMDGEEFSAMYDVVADPGETKDILNDNKELKKAFDERITYWRNRFGCHLNNLEGDEIRNPAHYPNSEYLLPYDIEHEYIEELYDMGDRG